MQLNSLGFPGRELYEEKYGHDINGRGDSADDQHDEGQLEGTG